MHDKLENWLMAWVILLDCIIVIVSLGFIDWLVFTSIFAQKMRERDLSRRRTIPAEVHRSLMEKSFATYGEIWRQLGGLEREGDDD